MSSASSSVKTEVLYICRICGKVGTRTQPANIDFGGCTAPSRAHIFQKLEVVLKEQAAEPAKQPDTPRQTQG
jgi:hypothetical protein